MTGTPSPRALRLRRSLQAAVTDHLALKGTAVLLAVVLWFIVSAKEPAEEIIAVRFQPSLDSSLRVRDGAPPIRALVIGSGRELLKLYSSPPVIRRPISADVPDTLELTLRPEDVDLPPGVEAIVRDVQPRRVTMTFEPELTKMVPVRTALRLEADTVPREQPVIRFEPDSVRVTGPRRKVALLNAVRTVAIIVRAADSTAMLVPLDTTELSRVRLRPASVFAQVLWRPVLRVAPGPAPTPADSSAPRTQP